MVNAYDYFKTHTKYNKLIGEDFLLVEYIRPVNPKTFQFWTEWNVITYIASGAKIWQVLDKDYHLDSENALFTRKGVYSIKERLKDHYCVLLFFISDNFIKKFLTANPDFKCHIKPNIKHDTIFKIKTNQAFNTLIDSFSFYLKQETTIPKNLIEIKFNELLFNIVMTSENIPILKLFNAIYQTSSLNLENIMFKNFLYDLKLNDFANLCGKSLSTFKRDFNTCFNMPPSKWLKNKRLEYAKTLLLNSDLNVNQICYKSGFKNNSHFIKCFKTKYKLTPNQYKIKHLND